MKKNIIYIYADDLGRGMLSCYGQKEFTTPNIDRLAQEGMRFTNFCGTAFCAPARASLICGIHDAHAGQWGFTPGGYYKKVSTGEVSFDQLQEVLQCENFDRTHNGEFLATIAQKGGYVTAEIGKLEWGFCTNAKQMREHGWDYHYGFYDHIQAHGYYPPFMIENGRTVKIEGNTDPHCGRPSYKTMLSHAGVGENPKDMSFRKQYSQDLFDEKIIRFIRTHQKVPFFLYHPSQLPHGPIFYPEIHPQVQAKENLTPLEKEYASMVLRLDETVGKIITVLEELNLRENTLIIFASDNGHTIDYQKKDRCMIDISLDGMPTDDLSTPFRTETCGDFFNGNDSMAGLKFSNWNGGCVIPFIASCPGYVAQGVINNTLAANYDTLTTIAGICDIPAPSFTDGISYLPLLRGESTALTHDYVIYGGPAPAIMHRNGWKLRLHLPDELLHELLSADLTHDPRTVFQLYNWQDDLAERNDLSAICPEIVAQLKTLLLKECDGNFLNGISDTHRIQPAMQVPTWLEIIEDKI